MRNHKGNDRKYCRFFRRATVYRIGADVHPLYVEAFEQAHGYALLVRAPGVLWVPITAAFPVVRTEIATYLHGSSAWGIPPERVSY